uniref:Uncharacterized protein n=1 Tax=Cannabis sativa TaxID=3483 RepID=A0A803NJQ9_CANSA
MGSFFTQCQRSLRFGTGGPVSFYDDASGSHGCVCFKICYREIEFLEVKPSEVAAAVSIFVLAETKTVDTEVAVFVLIQLVEKKRVLRCIEMIQNLDQGLKSIMPKDEAQFYATNELVCGSSWSV